MTPDEKRAYQRENMRRWREKQRALGIKPKPSTEDQRRIAAERIRKYRAAAAERGEILKVDDWHVRNPEAHLVRVRRYRAENADRQREVSRTAQAERRSTPWGLINNNIVVVLHQAVRRGSSRVGKYSTAIGYAWADLRAHLEAQFAPDMSWDNWGDVWELDHIKPLSLFRYESLDDPLFREAWALTNLRPLHRAANASKGAKYLSPSSNGDP